MKSPSGLIDWSSPPVLLGAALVVFATGWRYSERTSTVTLSDPGQWLAVHVFDQGEISRYLSEFLRDWLREESALLRRENLGIQISDGDFRNHLVVWQRIPNGTPAHGNLQCGESHDPHGCSTRANTLGRWDCFLTADQLRWSQMILNLKLD